MSKEMIDLLWFCFLELLEKYGDISSTGLETLIQMKLSEGWDYKRAVKLIQDIISKNEQ